MNNPVVYDYKGSQISFISGDSVMINATQMAKPFGKRPNDYLSLPSTNELLKAITRKYGIAENQLVITERGGLNPGTWLREDVALDFAQWLSVDFRLWCNDRLKELMKTGVTTVSNDDEAIAYAMQVLQKRLEQAKAENVRLEADNTAKEQTIQIQTEQIKQSAPKVKYYDDTLQSVNTLTTTQVAKERGMDAEKLNKRLKEAGIIYRQSGQWIIKQPYASWGLHKTRTQTYTRSDGSTGTSTYLVWTQKGKMFLLALIDNGYSVRKAIRQIKGENAA